ncbi:MULTISPECIES: TlyA family RNA methyltransferase [unclassified Oceanispirochaeta]|uniref:TlyA family RNA methyltransferase n=1 Tax=unclassified Oceanispirochaeta TaxID=2635722 RepID=UPI000E091E51|nr:MULTISPECIES: TlyA family RNA methyltransferase [unclassified Oceanispirochaeta]MBF9017158.1 TlyA family RNA methyltransferase [Oceanispirochaeta sp. M2]NPD73607.1 TlyA family RNA methyltransferase [Oceanispirochaeta sp. M1]RDG30710.1 TlyA family RNA methyltransferase [Oceanispirochaeta sp. M1]
MKKQRLLQLASRQFPEYSEKELFASILCGELITSGEKIKDPKALVASDAKLELSKKKYVSRGGFKLEKVLEYWSVPVKGKRILDAGCSTGGFTDCLLQKGALSVYAVDVGYNQLDYSLRVNPAVVVMEKTNIMSVQNLDPKPHWAVADLSFRSLRSAASHILSLTEESRLIALMKPQFELENPDDDFDGIIRDPIQILEITRTVIDEMAEEGAFVCRTSLSPLTGRKGNQELLFDVSSDSEKFRGTDVLISELEKEFNLKS